MCEFYDHLYLQGRDCDSADKVFAAWVDAFPQFGRYGASKLPREKRARQGFHRVAPNRSRVPLAWERVAGMAMHVAACDSRLAAIMICVTDVGMALLNLVGSVSRTVEQANILVTVILLVFMLFNGFFANTQNVGPWFSWIRYINFIFYGTRAATINEFGGLEFECTEEEAETMGCTLTGEQFLTRLGFKKNTILLDCIIMIVMAFVFRCGTYVALKTLYWKKH